MNLDQNTRKVSALAKARRWASSFGVVALLLNVFAGPAVAGTYDGAMGRTTYVVMTGDVNGDGQNDVLLKAVPKIVMIPLDDDLSVPIPIPVPSPTFALISTSYGNYTLVINPGADILGNAAWKVATQQVAFSGPSGAFAATVTITAAAGDQASFVVSMAADTGLLQLTSTTAPPVNNAAGGSGSSSSDVPLAVAITPPYLTNPDAGTLPGDLTVANNGAASYSIPLVVPPGTAGLQPNLSLNYSGQGPNGRLGLGWSLGGLSSIHRCGKTMAQDAVNDRIKFAITDRLCLDGQRLVLVNLPLSDANYWSMGAEYRTEIDSFSRITVTGTDAVRGFKVESKDGHITTYGNGSAYVGAILGTAPINSGVTASQPVAKYGAQSWAIDKIGDRAGNYIKFSYVQDPATGEHRPSFIRYGAVGLPAHAAVQFIDEGRPDAWKRYIDETRNDLRTRLASVKTYVGANLDGDVVASGTLARDYTLTYEQSPTSGRSQLTSVKACANNPQSLQMECLPQTTFSWGKPDKAAGFRSLGMWAGAPDLTTHNPVPFEGLYHDADHADYFAFADFNGDGRGDVLEKRVAAVSMVAKVLNTWDVQYREWGNPIKPGTTQNQYRYFHNTGSGFANYTYKLDTNENFVVLDVGDFNGDGVLDLFASTTSGTKICISPLASAAALGAPGSTITFTCGAAVGGGAWGNKAQLRPYIFDAYGDGRSAVYSNKRDTGEATFCNLAGCQIDPAPPAVLGLDVRRTAAWQGENPEFNYTSLNQMVDFAGVGKPYDTRFTAATLTQVVTDWDAIPTNPQWEWVNTTPLITMTSLGAPGFNSQIGGMADYQYPDPPATGRLGYLFDHPVQGGLGVLDLSGSGYNSLAFGYLELGWNPDGTRYNVRAETTLCQSTGRALDCGVRKKYSGAQYRAIQTVGNFVGDGQAAIMARTMALYNASMPLPTGAVEMCRVMGDDTTGGAGTDDANMTCAPWAGVRIPNDFETQNTSDQVYFMDLLGTGRMQIVYYHRGTFSNSTWIPGAGWEVFEPIDVAATGEALDRIVKVTNGVGATASLEYVDGLTSGVVSKSGTAALSYPLQSSSPAGKIVRRLITSNGSAADRSVRYSYQDAATDVAGRGALGFRVVTTTNEQTNSTSTSTYAQAWPLTGMQLSNQVVAGNLMLLSDTTNQLGTKLIPQANGATTAFTYVAGSSVCTHDLSGPEFGRAIVAGKDVGGVQYDNWGNVLNSKTSLQGCGDLAAAFSTTVENTYYPIDLANWNVGLLKRAVTTKYQQADGVSIPRTVDFTYEPNASGKVLTTVQEPGDINLMVTKTFVRNAMGLVTSTETKWTNPADAPTEKGLLKKRTDSASYDGNGRYPVTGTNTLGHVETYDYYPATGVHKNAVDHNGLPTTWVADGFGRVSKVTDPVGNEARSYVKACLGTCPLNATIVRIAESFHGTDRITVPKLEYIDNANHVLRSQTWGIGGRVIVVDQRYDLLGRPEENDHPRFIDAPAIWASHVYYDELNRVWKTVTRDDAGGDVITTTDFKGLVIELTNPKKLKRIETRNVAGQLKKVLDTGGYTTQFSYDPFGMLTKTIDPNGNIITVGYDALGRKTSLTDPDLGLINYKFDPVGQVYEQISPKQRALGQATTFIFDDLGRMTERNETDLHSVWVFDSAINGKGQLAESYTGTALAKTYQRTHTYDGLGRPARTTQVLTDGSYTAEPAYDLWGRMITQTYRRGSSAAKVFASRYDNLGALNRIERGSLVLRQILDADAAGRLTKSVLGNGLVDSQLFNRFTGRLYGASIATGAGAARVTEGYEYDIIGSVYVRNLFWDTNGFQENLAYDVPGPNNGFRETFTYDELNRIRTSTVDGQAVQNFTYDAAGNMLSKTGVGTGNYQYPAQGSGAVLPHAVANIPGIGAFVYDSNGNLTGGAQRTVTWSSFDMPSRIEKLFGTVNVWANFAYGPEHERTRQDRSDGSQVVYAAAQEVETKGGQTTVKTYWPAGIGLEIDKPDGSTELNWTHKDQLGSPIGLTDQNGALREKLAYDAWGKRRTLAGAPVSGNPTPDSIDGKVDNRGYTGHEMLDQLDLVHMNGRVYDPITARFMSADPILQDPMNGQSYNRYSYVMNNPTNLTDPTGFKSCEASTGSKIKTCTEEPVAVELPNGSRVSFKTKAEAERAVTDGVGKIVQKSAPPAATAGKSADKGTAPANGGAWANPNFSGGGAADRGVEQFRADVEAGNGEVYAPLRPVAVAVTGGALALTGGGMLALTAAGRASLVSLGLVYELEGASEGVPRGGSASLGKAGAPAAEVAEIGVITTRTTKNTTRLGGQAGEPGLKITYKNGTEFDMTATRVKQTELNPYVPGGTRPVKFLDAVNKQGDKRAPTAEEIKWFNSLDWK